MLALRLGRLRPAAALRYSALSSSFLSSPLPSSSSVIRPGIAALHNTPPAEAKAKHIKRTTLTPAQRKALVKQQLLAAAIGAGSKTPVTEPESKAADVRREERVPTSTVLTLDDLEPFNPHGPGRPRSREYRQQYAELTERLDNAFVRKQIVKLNHLLGLKTKRSDTKSVLIARLMAAAWEWTKPLTKEETTYTRDIPLTKAQMFVLQRSDDVADRLAKMTGVRFGIEATETGTFLLKAQGRRDAVEELDAYLATQTRACVSVEWPVSAMNSLEPSEKGLWGISTATGAIVEAVGWTSLRATAGSREAAERARDMILRAAARYKVDTFRPALGALLPPHDPALDTRFALVPHRPANLAPLPWSTELAAAERPLFRLSRVEGRQESSGARELRHRSVEISAARVLPLSTSGREEAGTLEAVVSQTLDKASLPAGNAAAASATRSLSFRFGHFLTQGGSDPEKALTPPIEGAWPLDEPASPWLKLSTPVFSPSLPPALIRFPLPGAPRRLRRVTYVADGMRYVAEYAYPVDKEPEAAEATRESKPWIVALDRQLAMARQQAEERRAATAAGVRGNGRPTDESASGSAAAGSRASPEDIPFDFGAVKSLLLDEEPTPAQHAMSISATMGREAGRDIILPDRPIDARIVAGTSYPASVPDGLEAFFARVHADADGARLVSMTDVEGLRRGTGPQKAEVEMEVEDESGFWGEEEGWGDEEWEGEPRRDLEAGEAREVHGERKAEKKAKAREIIAPPQITVAGHVFTLEADEVLEVIESSVALERSGSSVAEESESDSESEGETGAEEGAEEAGPRATLRTLAVADLTGPGGVVRYAELHAELGASSGLESETGSESGASSGIIDPAIWRELANATREVPPGVRGTTFASI